MATGNTPPSVDAGSDDTIPRVAVRMTGSGSDFDGDGLLFTWSNTTWRRRRDINTVPGDGPLLRPLPSTADGDVRSVPNMTDILLNTERKGEFCPRPTRSTTVRLTARRQPRWRARDLERLMSC